MEPDKRDEDRVSAAALKAQAWLTPVFGGLAILAAAAGGSIVLLIGVSVVMRYVANAPLYFTEELVGLLMTAAFFLALPLVTLRGDHVRVTIVVSNLSPGVRRRVALAAALFGLAFCLWFFVLCIPWFEFAYQRSLKTEVARLLMYPWMAVIPASLILTALAFTLNGLVGEQPDDPER